MSSKIDAGSSAITRGFLIFFPFLGPVSIHCFVLVEFCAFFFSSYQHFLIFGLLDQFVKSRFFFVQVCPLFLANLHDGSWFCLNRRGNYSFCFSLKIMSLDAWSLSLEEVLVVHVSLVHIMFMTTYSDCMSTYYKPSFPHRERHPS